MLTGRPPHRAAYRADGVHYALEPEVSRSSRMPIPLQFLLQRRSREQHNVEFLQETLAGFRPEVILLWNMQRLQRRLTWLIEQTPGTQVAYYSMGTTPLQPDEYSAYWTAFAQQQRAFPIVRIISRLALRQIRLENPGTLRLDCALCASDYVRRALCDEGVWPPHSVVVRPGVGLDRFPLRTDTDRNGRPLRLLMVCQMLPEREWSIVVEAMSHLVQQFGTDAPLLTVYSQEPGGDTRALIAERGLTGVINLQREVDCGHRPAIMQQHDVLLLPELRNEPPTYITQQAMAAGLIVVSTLTHGLDEIIQDGVNGLAVSAHDARSLADGLAELIQRPDHARHLALQARCTVEAEMTLAHMLNDMEIVLDRFGERKRLGPPLLRAHSRPLFDLRRWAARPLRTTGPLHDRLRDEQHLALAVQWLTVAQEMAHNGGLAQLYDAQRREWAAAYPETTGYAVPTLLHYARETPDRQLRERVQRMAQFLLSVQLADGSVPVVHNEMFSVVQPCVFDVGQVIFGYLAAYEEFKHPDYAEAARRAGDWLVRHQEPDGSWARFTFRNVVHAWEVRVSWALLLLARATDDQEYEIAARKNISWTCSVQQADGWFNHLALMPGEPAVMHTIAYTLEGLLECGVHLNDAGRIAAARLPADILLERQRADGALPGAFAARWSSIDHFTCLTGNAQMAIVWQRLYQLSGESKYLEASDRILDHACRSQLVRTRDKNLLGGLPGSEPIDGDYLPGRLPNWSVKFLMDALLLRRAIRRQGRTAVPPPR
jgi:glycosyltransferase involved in cell wall biosynthesis